MSISGENTESDIMEFSEQKINSHEAILNLTKKSIRQYKTLFTLKKCVY